MKAWEQNPDPEASIDCCIAHVFSWGHTVGASFHRRSAEYDFPEQTPGLPPSWQRLPPDQTFPQPPYICQDFHIRAAERHKRWTNSDLWLFDTDCNWHMPLFFTVREMTQRAKRIRTKERQMARKAVQRTRQAEKNGTANAVPRSAFVDQSIRRAQEEDQKEQEDEETTHLDLYSDRVPEQQPASPQPPPTVRPEYPPGDLSPEVLRRIQELLQGAKSFTVINLPKTPEPMPMPKITITYTNPVYQGPPSRPASPEPRTPTEPFEPADPTVTTKAKPPPPKYSPGEAGNYFPSRPPSRQHAYKTPPETQPVYTANPSPQATPIRPNPRGNPPRQYGPNQPFSPGGQYYQQAPSQPFTPCAASSSRDMPFGPASTPPKVRASAPYAPAPRPPKFWAKGPSTQQTSPLPEQPPSRLLSIQNYQQFASLTAICL